MDDSTSGSSWMDFVNTALGTGAKVASALKGNQDPPAGTLQTIKSNTIWLIAGAVALVVVAVLIFRRS